MMSKQAQCHARTGKQIGNRKRLRASDVGLRSKNKRNVEAQSSQLLLPPIIH
uniref:Uncharacterized protein n=1 Tax=Rhizophora mucronata TaxID=61149 RepID=A0A2P2QRX7_RHIMU